ncbi:hypothetical protein M3Y94_00401400 [Aphelenchoides besseyi]|nr:hypothetical protein M3Y94_00401400 [Aphelenchoides besseyi]
MDFVFEYSLFNTGDRTALKVSLDDRHSFPTQSFEVIKGLLQVRWEKIPPGGNVTHSVIIRPRNYGVFNHTAAQVTYYPKEDAKEVRVGYTTAPGEGHIYRLRDYERRFSSKWFVWVVFFLMTLPTTAVPFAIWWQLRNKYPGTNVSAASVVEKVSKKSQIDNFILGFIIALQFESNVLFTKRFITFLSNKLFLLPSPSLSVRPFFILTDHLNVQL